MSEQQDTTDNTLDDQEALLADDNEHDKPDKPEGTLQIKENHDDPESDDDTMAAKDDTMTMQDTMVMEDKQHDRIEDLTKSILALDALGEVNPDISYRKNGFSRYRQALKGTKPIRFSKPKETEMPVTKAGLFSLMTFSWMSSIMWGIFRQGIETIKDMKVGPTEKAKPNADRLSIIWEDEVKRRGLTKASLTRSCLKFLRTRMIIATMFLFLTSFCMFTTPIM